MATKDYIRPLFELIASGSLREFTRQGNDALVQIAIDIQELETQLEIIRRAVSRYGTSVAGTVPGQTALPLEKVAHVGATGKHLDRAKKTEVQRIAVDLALANPDRQTTSGAVVQALLQKGVILEVGRPSAVVASILGSTRGFTKKERATYEYKPG